MCVCVCLCVYIHKNIYLVFLILSISLLKYTTLIYSSHVSLFKRDGLNVFLLILVSGSSVVYFCRGLSLVMSSVPTSSQVL